MSKDRLVLKASVRREKAKKVRQNGFIPAIFYAKGKPNVNLQIPYHDFRRTFEKSGYNTIIDLEIDDKKKTPVLVQEVELDPIRDTFLHIDFIGIKMNEKITAAVPLKTVGQSAAVKDLGGILIHNKDEVEIECLPADLIHAIEVNLEKLVDFHCSVTVADLNVPENIKIIDDPETTLLTVSAPRKAEEETEEEGAAETGEEKKETNSDPGKEN